MVAFQLYLGSFSHLPLAKKKGAVRLLVVMVVTDE